MEWGFVEGGSNGESKRIGVKREWERENGMLCGVEVLIAVGAVFGV